VQSHFTVTTPEIFFQTEAGAIASLVHSSTGFQFAIRQQTSGLKAGLESCVFVQFFHENFGSEPVWGRVLQRATANASGAAAGVVEQEQEQEQELQQEHGPGGAGAAS
jgi:hypothetical protein